MASRISNSVRPSMIKTVSLSVLFFLAMGLLFAAYASVPA